MIRRLLAGCVGAFWLQFCLNLASQAAGLQPDAEISADEARVESILARCAADRAACGDHSPETVSRWVDFADTYDVPILIAAHNRAIVLPPAPRRVH